MYLAYLSECLADTSPAAWLLQRQHPFQFEGEIHKLVTLSHESGFDGHLPAQPVRASCWGPGSSLSEPRRDESPPLPAQVLNTSDEEDEEVFGDDTPPPNLPEQREDQEPADVLFETIGTLWEEGNDLVVHMMEYYLSQQMRAGHEQDRQQNMDGAALAQRMAVLREARQVVRVYGVRQTLCQLSPWWSSWLENLLRGWRPHDGVTNDEADGETLSLMQVAQSQAHGTGYGRPRVWTQMLAEISEFPEGVRKGILLRLKRWLRRRVMDQGMPLVTLASMLQDLRVELRGVQPMNGLCGVEATEVDMAREVAKQLVVDLEKAVEEDDLRAVPSLPSMGAAICEAMEDLAVRADRREASDLLPNDNVSGLLREQEELEVGHQLTQWLRARLPTQWDQRSQLYQEILKGLQRQLREECRHLRRLHMAVQSLKTMGVGAVPGHDEEAEIDGMKREAADLVDQIVMMMGLEQRHPRSVKDWLRGGASSGRASSSTSFTTASQEAEALRRWLNELFEGDKADYWEDLEEMELDEVENADEDPDGMVERLGGVEPTQLDDEENEGDDVDLGQKGKPKGGGTRRSRRSRTRSRSRSTEEGQRTWSTASASGWGRFPPGGTGSDRNNHRPWRRMTRTEVETEAGIDVLRRRAGNSATSSPNARPTAS